MEAEESGSCLNCLSHILCCPLKLLGATIVWLCLGIVWIPCLLLRCCVRPCSGTTCKPHWLDPDSENQWSLLVDSAGGLGPWYMGILMYLYERFDKMDQCHYYCISAGNFIIFYLANDGNMSEEDTTRIFQDMRTYFFNARGLGFCGYLNWMEHALDNHLPENIHEIINGKMSIGFTHFPSGKLHFKHRFTDKEDVIQAILASCSTCPFAGSPRCCMDNQIVCDGSHYSTPLLAHHAFDYTLNALSVDPRLWNRDNVLVSNLSPLRMLILPRVETGQWIMECGYEDMASNIEKLEEIVNSKLNSIQNKCVL